MRKTNVQIPTATRKLKKETLRPLSNAQLALPVGGYVQPTLTGHCY